jgi:acyl carrier protein
MNDAIITKLRRLLIEHLFVELPEEQIGLDDGLQSVVGLDSVGFVELRLLCERFFNVQIADEHYTPEHFSSIRKLSALIELLQAEQSKTATP